MARITPQAHFITNESWNRWNETRASYGETKSKYEVKTHNTYVNLKKHIKEYCTNNIDSRGVAVYRSRRGQWGEWFEYWKLVDDVPTIVESGWS